MATPDYLTPYDELIEATNLGERTLTAARAQNPLYQRDAAILSGAPAPEVPVASTAGPNPLSPPVPLSTMGTEQRIAWQQLQDTQRAQQAALEKTMLDTEVTRTERELKDEERRQSIALIAEAPKLKEAVTKGDLDGYLTLKADFVSRYPVGSGSIEAQRAFKSFDDVIARKTSVEDEVKKAATARSEATRQRRIDAGYKDAEKQGADVLREYAAIIDKDPVKGPDDANKYLAVVQQRNITQGLRDAGLSDQDIVQRYGGGQTGRPFDYQAASQGPKSRAFLATERNRAGSEVLALDKQRKGYDPTAPDPYANAEDWNEDKEQIYQQKREYWRSLTPEIGSNRAGVQNMSPGAIQVAQQQAFNYATTPAQIPARPAVPPQRVPITQQQARAVPTPTAPVTAPKAVPPPLNPAYPEQWVGGKRYVQMPDGKLYLSKVQ